MGPRWIAVTTILVVIQQISLTSAIGFGINYGTMGNNLPPPKQVIDFIASKSIQSIRLFDPNLEILEALRGTKLAVSIGTRNEDLASIAGSQAAADNWVNTFIIPYKNNVNIRWISAGNEVIPGPNAQYVVPAMKNIKHSLTTLGLHEDISVTTVVAALVLGTSYPPSQGNFASEVADIMSNISNLVYKNGDPLMINVYPYFAYVSDPTNIGLDFALFNSTKPGFKDGDLAYYNLFDSMVDAFYAAMVRVVGKKDVKLIVSETGWPSSGNEPATSIVNAQTYNNNLKKHVLKRGTPRRPNILVDTFIFALFNENLKPAGVEQNFGSFYPDLKPVYPL